MIRSLGTDAATIHRNAAAGDQVTLRRISQASEALGLGLAALINLINPGLLVLGGGTLAYPGYFDSAMAAAEKYSLPDFWKTCSVRKTNRTHPEYGDLSVALGAVCAASRITQDQHRALPKIKGLWKMLSGDN